jgi:DNA-binding response OmpR family regulator
VPPEFCLREIMSKKPLVLVVDDDQHLGEFLQMALGKDWRVILAEDGLQAVELILMDINMPRLNGWNAIREIRAMGIAVPIVVMTGFPDPSDQIKAQELGVVECLYKPFNILRLRELIHRQMKSYLAAQESKKSHMA